MRGMQIVQLKATGLPLENIKCVLDTRRHRRRSTPRTSPSKSRNSLPATLLNSRQSTPCWQHGASWQSQSLSCYLRSTSS